MNDIDNTKLEEVMQAYIQGKDKDNLIRLVYAIADTKLFVPAMVVQKKGGFQPYAMKNAEGDMYMPAFTSAKKFPAGQKYQGMLKIQYSQCVSMLLDNPTLVQGIVLNPFSDNLMLKTQMLELSRKIEQDAQKAKEAKEAKEAQKAQKAQQKPKAYAIKPDDFRMVARHNVEFHQLPEKLFAQKLEFIKSLSEETICGLYKAPYVEAGQEGNYPYTQDDFEMMQLSIREDLNIVQILTPSRYQYQTNCREIYIVWNPLTVQISYYVVEKGLDSDQNKFYLGIVREDGSKEQLEEAPAEGNVMNRVMELFGGGL